VNVTITRGGGMAGVATRTQLTAEALPTGARERLRELASAVGPADAAGTRHPDETLYKIEVDGRSASYTETTLPDPVRALITFVDERPERQDELALPKRG
jgi:emfourin